MCYNIPHNIHPKSLKAFWGLHMLGIISHVFLRWFVKSLWMTVKSLPFQKRIGKFLDFSACQISGYVYTNSWHSPSITWELPGPHKRSARVWNSCKVYRLLRLMSKNLFWVFLQAWGYAKLITDQSVHRWNSHVVTSPWPQVSFEPIRALQAINQPMHAHYTVPVIAMLIELFSTFSLLAIRADCDFSVWEDVSFMP